MSAIPTGDFGMVVGTRIDMNAKTWKLGINESVICATSENGRGCA